jgi:hypothetical protein
MGENRQIGRKYIMDESDNLTRHSHWREVEFSKNLLSSFEDQNNK